MLPGTSGSGSAVLLTVSRALVLTVASVWAELLSPLGSGVGVSMPAMLVMVLPAPASAATVPLSVIRMSLPVPPGEAAMSPSTQAAGSQVLPSGRVATTPVTVAGTVSVRVTARASDGPSLCTVTVQVIASPAVAVSGPVLVTDTSARSPMVASAVEVLLSGNGSAVSEVTLAVFDTVLRGCRR